MDDAKNCTDCRRCAVRIFAAINCDAKALFKIILAVQQTQNDDTQIVGSIHTGGAGRQILRQIGLLGKAYTEGTGELGKQFKTGLFPVLTCIVAFFNQTDRLCCQAVFGDIGQADPNQFPLVRYHKRSAFHCCAECSCIDAFLCMVNDCILIGIADSDFRMAGCHTGPDFRSDPGTIAVLIGIAHVTAQRRLHASPQIALAHAVLRPVGENIGHPVISQHTGIHPLAVLFCCVQPHQLQIQIVVSGRITVDVLSVEVHIMHHSGALLIGATEDTTHILAVPAT